MPETDGSDAVTKFTEFRNEIGLAVVDAIMPKMNGREVYEELERIKPEIRLIFTSGYKADIFNTDDIDTGKIRFVLKPVRPGDLLKCVREVLDGN